VYDGTTEVAEAGPAKTTNAINDRRNHAMRTSQKCRKPSSSR
jgi:hypothetical protein